MKYLKEKFEVSVSLTDLVKLVCTFNMSKILRVGSVREFKYSSMQYNIILKLQAVRVKIDDYFLQGGSTFMIFVCLFTSYWGYPNTFVWFYMRK